MENNKIVSPKLILGGALLSAFLVLANVSPMPIFEWMRMMRISTAEAYDKENTHPALTDEIVDFFRLSFLDKTITEEEKQWLIKGAIDEDTLERPLYHFYDPVYNRGIAGISSKDWATKDGVQAAYYNSQFTGFAAISGGDSVNDFSYDRALRDYAKGDRKRAFVAFGHTLHLLEDAGVPDHTRNDAHPSFIHGQESPYESEMAKWNPENFNIARSLFLRREKPASLNSVESYFDKIANYSNNNFFSKDTISNKNYSKPLISSIKSLRILGKNNYFVVGTDPISSKEFPLAFLETKIIRDNPEILGKYLVHKEIGSYILDGYWDRLSKEVVISGAGALRLFLEEAETARREYLVKAEQKKPSFWAQVASLFGFGRPGADVDSPLSSVSNDDGDELSTPTSFAVGAPTGTSGQSYPQGVGDGDTDGDSGDTTGDKKVSPTLSPVLSPLPLVSPLVLPLPSPSPFAKATEDKEAMEGEASPQLSTIKKTGGVVINEIAWAGTEASTADEWIELYNAESYDIDISGWTLKAEDGTPDITIEEGKIIKAQSYFLLERTDDTTVNSVAADQIYTGALGNEGEYLKLSDSSGIVVGIAGNSGESWPAGSSIGKYSMERTNSGGPDASVGVNWKNFTGSPSAKDANGNFINGTPKAANSTAVVTYGSGGGGGGGGGGSSSPDSTSSPQATPTPSPSVTPTPIPSPEPEGDTNGDTASSGDVIINEIAWMGTDESHLCEWIELRNTTSNEINLAGWGIYEDGGETEIMSLTGQVSPNGYYLIERVTNSCPDPVLGINDDAGTFGGSGLANTGENLVLKNTAGTIINQVDGSNGWKLNGDDEVIGKNESPKETAQKFGNVWKTAEPTPKAENQANTTAQNPSAVTNLAAAHNSPTVTATWTAPDPGTYTPASLSYDLRYSATIFTEAASASWWSDATQVASASLPSVGEQGASQSASFDVTHEYGQTLYFGLKTKVINTCEMNDTACRSSGVSNLALVSWPGAVDDDAWAMLGKDPYHTSFAANTAGPSPTATISWEFDSGAGQGISQPVVDSDGNIYFGASDGTLANSKIYSIKEDGGNVIENWAYSTNVSIGTPAVLSDKTVYFGRVGAGGVQWVTALNSDGSNKWDYMDSSSVNSVAVSADGGAYFATNANPNSRLKVLNSSGELNFEKIGPGFYDFSPVVLDDGMIITAGKISGNQQFTAYSATGSQSWQVFSSPDTYGNTPADPSYDKTTGTTYSAAGPKLFSIPSDGSTLNATDIAPWDYKAATTVAISSDTLFVGFNSPSSASGSLLYALNKSNLTTKWSFQAAGLLNKQLAIDNAGNVYFSTQNGKLYSVDNAGTQRWVIDSDLNSTISPVLTEHGLVWGYGSRVVVISD